MIDLKGFEVWFITGSQHLYGEKTLRRVEEHALTVASSLHNSEKIPVKVISKPVLTTREAICQVKLMPVFPALD